MGLWMLAGPDWETFIAKVELTETFTAETENLATEVDTQMVTRSWTHKAMVLSQ